MLSIIEHNQITAADTSLSIQQKALPSESVGCVATLMNKNQTLLQLPCTKRLHKELSSSFSVPICSCADAIRGPLAEQFIHKNSSKYFSENEDTTSDHEYPAIIDMPRSPQDISDNYRSSSLSDSNASFLHKKHTLQASLTANVAASKASHINGVEPIYFTSFPDTEGIYDYISNVALPRHIIPKG